MNAASKTIERANTIGTSVNQHQVRARDMSSRKDIDLHGSDQPLSITPDWVKLNMNRLNPLTTRNPPDPIDSRDFTTPKSPPIPRHSEITENEGYGT